mmetsp:Transcript_26154/g.49390  ORF Transcript_26154/g.49390 Transcript_26154/m.49390 type:complete len:370 (-) Transcript_26154:1580-2689(-)
MNMKSSIVMMSLPPTNGVSGTETARAHPRHQSSGQNVREILGWKFALCVSCTGLMKQKEISIRDRVCYSRALCCRHRLKSYASQASFYESFYDTATLGTWLLDQERNGAIDSELAVLGSSIATACKQISTLVGRAGISDLMGLHGEINVQGEDQKKLDVVANEVFCAALRNSGRTGVLASEENEVPIAVEETNSGKYVVVFDPLDGSSNLDAAVATGSIFGIYAATTSCLPEDSEGTVEENCLANVCQPGSNLLAAGYCMYSSSTIMVISVGDGVYGFTLDPMIGEFVQSHERITIPEKGKIYSFNEGNYHSWSDGLKAYIDSLKTGGLEGGKPYSARYVGAFHVHMHLHMHVDVLYAVYCDHTHDRYC